MKKVISIEGMMCPHCSGCVTEALNAVEGVSAEVSHETGKAVCTLQKDVADDVLSAAVTGAGYQVIGIE